MREERKTEATNETRRDAKARLSGQTSDKMKMSGKKTIWKPFGFPRGLGQERARRKRG